MRNNEFESKFALMLTGDEEAFTYVYNETKKPVYTIINRIVNNRCESEDIMQDLFLRLISKKDLDKVKNPRAYIFMMARNMAIDSLRKEHPDYLEEDVADMDSSSFDEQVCLTSSIEDAILDLFSFVTFILSTKISMVCFLYLSSSISSSRLYIFLSTRTLLNPSFKSLSNNSS